MDSDFPWYTDESRRFMECGYLDGATLTDRVDIICRTSAKLLGEKAPEGYEAKLKEGIRKGWCSLSTPIWANFGAPRGLGISCFSSYVGDSIESIMGETHSEVAMMTKNGGGTSIYMGDIRGRGAPITNNGTSFGSVHFAEHYQSLIKTTSQGGFRRGNAALYWPIDHPDINEVLTIRGDGSPIQDLHFGITVKDAWLREMVVGDPVKRTTWAKLLNARRKHGEPYVVFHDTMNRLAPKWFRDKGLVIRGSNLCAETTPTSNELESYICCLSSLNVFHFDEWCDTDFPEIMVYFLDSVLTEFINKAKLIKYMDRAVRYAERYRSIGIGWLGWHSYLQSKMVPFESMEAKRLNALVARTIHSKTIAASERMAKDYGEPEVTKGYGRRHALLHAIAPTKSSAFILGQVSEGIEPIQSNYLVEDKAKGKFTTRNKELVKLLQSKGKDTKEVWNAILLAGGSVQGLAFLENDEKATFKTFLEISQMEVIQQAAQRVPYIDQSQSLNIMLHASVPAKDVNALMLKAWELDIKSLYYQHNDNKAQMFARDILSCGSCEA